MFNKILEESTKAITTVATAATLVSYYDSIQGKKLMSDYANIVKENTQIRKELAEITQDKINVATDGIKEVKLAALESQLSENMANFKNCQSKLESFNTDNLGAATDLKTCIINANNAAKAVNNTLIELHNVVFDKTNKLVSNGLAPIKDLMEKWNLFISQLTLEQLGAVAHILSSILILFCLSTIIMIIYSDYLIKYLNLELKYPRLARYIKIRRTFQQYYLFINFMLIIVTLFAVIFVNLTIFT